MNKKHKRCQAQHPRIENIKCWAAWHPEDMQHWAIVSVQGSNETRKIFW